MANLFDLVRDDPRVLTLIEALLSDKDSTAGPGPLAVLRIQQKKARAAIKQKADSFSELYEQAAPGNANQAAIDNVQRQIQILEQRLNDPRSTDRIRANLQKQIDGLKQQVEQLKLPR